MTLASAIAANPFYQPARQWQIRVFIPQALMPAVEEAFEDLALAMSLEVSEDTSEYYVDIITDVPPENADIAARLALISGLLNITTPRCEIALLEAKDWVSEVERSFPPLHVGRFYVHGSHVEEPVPYGKLALEVNAGAAFGSGEHATTSGCLLALSQLAKRRRVTRALDMGCGSGILAIAMAKLWHAPVIGIDIDPVSIMVARKNAKHNRAQAYTDFAAADGYHSALVRDHAPFDLIVANILARPLIKMAPLLAAHLAPGGIAVLSGLLVTQEKMVLNAHRAQALRLVSRIKRNGWDTLILEKRNGVF